MRAKPTSIELFENEIGRGHFEFLLLSPLIMARNGNEVVVADPVSSGCIDYSTVSDAPADVTCRARITDGILISSAHLHDNSSVPVTNFYTSAARIYTLHSSIFSAHTQSIYNPEGKMSIILTRKSRYQNPIDSLNQSSPSTRERERENSQPIVLLTSPSTLSDNTQKIPIHQQEKKPQTHRALPKKTILTFSNPAA